MYHIISITGLIVNDSAGKLSFGGCPTILSRMLWMSGRGQLIASVLQQCVMSCAGSMHNCVVMHHITLVYAVGGCTDTNLYASCDLYRGR